MGTVLNRLKAEIKKKFPAKQSARPDEMLKSLADVAAFSHYGEQSGGPNTPAARLQNCVSRSL